MCGHEDRAPWETGGEEKDGEEDDREWKPEACFVATDVEYGGRVVDLTRDITRGPLERVPGRDKIWRVPHNVKVGSDPASKPTLLDQLGSVLLSIASLKPCAADWCGSAWPMPPPPSPLRKHAYDMNIL